jgi:hypothetical protein
MSADRSNSRPADSLGVAAGGPSQPIRCPQSDCEFVVRRGASHALVCVRMLRRCSHAYEDDGVPRAGAPLTFQNCPQMTQIVAIDRGTR